MIVPCRATRGRLRSPEFDIRSFAQLTDQRTQAETMTVFQPTQNGNDVRQSSSDSIGPGCLHDTLQIDSCDAGNTAPR